TIISQVHLTKVSETLTNYLLFIFLNFVFLYIFFELFLSNRITKYLKYNNVSKNIILPFIIVSKTNTQTSRYAYIATSIALVLFLFINLCLKYDQLSYFNQVAVKGNIIWLFSLQVSFYFIANNFILFFKSGISSKNAVINSVMAIALLSVVSITLFKIGNRGIAFPFLLAGSTVFIQKNRLLNLKKLFLIVSIIFLIIGFSQFLRSNRGNAKELSQTKFEMAMILDFFSFRSILFQDYTSCASSLMYTIENQIIDPYFYLLSTLGNSIFFLNYPSIPQFISRKVFPDGGFGIGGLIFNDGFVLAGWLGAVILPFIITFSFRLYYDILLRKNDKDFKIYFLFVFASLFTLNLVRGQAYILFKALYMYFPLCIFIYAYSRGYKIRLLKQG
ncbi:MAG: oligosaccharide repeat unit polymerase, partial [Candidatus Absconditabacterales bacterium]|nr:oligosaccharide repeat unit polymerase [Candidatus Absconditabacterales bacterium]